VALSSRPAGRIDVLVVSLGTTGGWRAAAAELAGSLERVGAAVETVAPEAVPGARTFALTDFVQARAVRRAAQAGIERYRPRALVYCSVTASLLWPRPGAVWLDAIAAENRPGRHGVWQRTVERRRLRQAPLVMAMSERALEPFSGPRAPVVTVPVPVEPSADAAPVESADGPAAERRDVAAVMYAGDPLKKRLDVVLEAWGRARRDDEQLVVAGPAALAPTAGVTIAAQLAQAEYRALVRRARVFVAAPRREDYGIAPLEALADGCVLVTTPAPGPYPALTLARELDPRLVGDDLATAIRTALDDPRPGYAERAAALLAPFRRAAVDRTMAEDVLPRLLPGWGR
jgi:Glycosyl transferases group 1